MKKSLFIMALGAIALTSCSQDEVLEVKQDAIAFTAFTENASRADNVDGSALPNDFAFNVCAYETGTKAPYFMNIKASEDGQGGGVGNYRLASTYYWPINNLDFYSVYPSTIQLSEINAGNASAKIATYTCSNEGNPIVNHNEDLLYSVSMNTAKGSNGIANINFRHALSMLAFQAKSLTSYDLDVTISKIEIVNVAKTGSYALPNETTVNNDNGEGDRGEWTIAADTYTNTYSFDINDIVVDASVASEAAVASGDTYFALPQTLVTGKATKTDNTYFKLYCDIARNGVAIRENTTPVYIPIVGTWNEGMKYTYTFEFGQGAGYEEDLDTPVIVPISFNVTVDEIADAAEVSVPMI